MHEQAARNPEGHHSRLADTVVATSVTLVAGAKESRSLNSDNIRERFGHYGVELLHQDATTRLASLFSLTGEQRITRTLALTRFELPTHGAVAGQDRKIRGGASIGATLLDAGWHVEKDGTVDCQTLAGDRFSRLGGGAIDAASPVLVRVYTLKINSADLTLDYAVIAAAYHPEHIAPNEALPDTTTAITSMTDSQALALGDLLTAMTQSP